MNGSRWRSWHFYYHADRDRLLVHGLTPVLRSRLSQGWIDRFYFMRFSLGGPHVRLRVRLGPGGTRELVEQALTATAARFFAREPSTATLPEDAIRRHNAHVLARDPAEHDAAVYRDNSVRSSAFTPEVERYGGPDLIGHSLDFFTVSSVQVLELLESLQGEALSRSRRLSIGFRLLARQAWGLAGSVEEYFDLLRYPVKVERIQAKADQVFAKRPDDFRDLLSSELEALAAEPSPFGRSPVYLAGAARILSRRLESMDDQIRRRILTSQMHMSANRFGLENLEETYLGRLLWLTARDLKHRGMAPWKSFEGELADRPRRRPRNGAGAEQLLTVKLRDFQCNGPSAELENQVTETTTC